MGTLLDDLFTIVISHSFLLKARNFSVNICREIQNTFYVQELFPKIMPFFRQLEKYRDQTGHRLQCGACALHAG